METDILIIGSGIAGLSFALRVATERPDLRVHIYCKNNESESNTRYAQGGIAVVLDSINDSYEKHIEDTLRSGKGLCKRDVVELVVRKAPAMLSELLAWGVKFDKEPSGSFEMGLEGGHSCSRILHHKDFTGLEIERKLLQYVKKLPNITLYPHHFAIDLITGLTSGNEKICHGAYILDQNEKTIQPVKARVTMLATGGSGQVYKTTTNPAVATGDGVAMAHRAGAQISDMQFVQFHPTALYSDEAGPSFLISEAVRGYGAWLVDGDGYRFMFDHDERGELATRDIVSKAIHAEMLKSGAECVFLDCRHLDQKKFRKHFPVIYNYCTDHAIDVSEDLIPVIPAAHYQCGGIVIGKNSETSIRHLYAGGECSCSGLHGANRLASNSLLEAVVFSDEAACDVLQKIDAIKVPRSFLFRNYVTQPADYELLNFIRKEIRTIMTLYAGVDKTREGLLKAKDGLANLKLLLRQAYSENHTHFYLWEVKNILEVARLIVGHSLKNYDQLRGLEKRDLIHKEKVLQ